MPSQPQVEPASTAASAASAQRVFRGHAALVAVQVCFGLFPIFGKLAFQVFVPRSVACWRIASAALVMSVAGLLLHRRAFFPAARDLPKLFLFGLLGVVLNQLLFLEGLSRSSAIHAGLIVCLIPVFVFVIATCLAHEHFDRMRAIGIAVALSGSLVLLLQRTPGSAAALDPTTGDLLMVANGVCYAFYLVLSRPLLQRYPPLVVMAWVFLGSLWCVPLLLASESVDLVPEGSTPAGWASLAFVLVFATWSAYLLVLYALARVSASTAAVYNYLQPFISALAAIPLLGERLTGTLVLAAGLMFLGLWLVIRPRRPAL